MAICPPRYRFSSWNTLFTQDAPNEAEATLPRRLRLIVTVILG
jgi:hypothetical protein